MPKKTFTIFLFLLLPAVSFAKQQHTSSFDSVFYKVATGITEKNPELALHLADSLFKASKDDVQRLRSLMLSAGVYQATDERKSAILLARRAEKIATRIKDVNWQIRISGFLSTQYQNIGFIKQGKKLMYKAEALLPGIKDSSKRKLFHAFILQEQAKYDNKDHQYNSALTLLKKADTIFSTLSPSRTLTFYRAANTGFRGLIYLKLKSLDSAKAAFLKTKSYINTEKEADYPMLYGFVYGGLGAVALAEGRAGDTVFHSLEKALPFADSSSNIELKMLVYESFSTYYKKRKDWENFSLYNQKIEKIRDRVAGYKTETYEQLFGDALQMSTHFRKKQETYLILLILLGSLTLLLSFFLIFYRSSLGGLRAVAAGIGRPGEKKSIATEWGEKAVNPLEHQEVGMTEETLQRLQQELEEFEEEHRFLTPDISISLLASQSGTNTKYLAYVLKHYKQATFNTYINELRIDYIVNRLREDATFRTFKISHLAEVTGFSSHSKFTSVFRKVKGITPSEFIRRLD